MKLLLIDNYDSFTYNLVQYFSELGADVSVVRNDQMSIDQIYKCFITGFIAQKTGAICLSPGPSSPKEAGICIDLIKKYSGIVPMLGVCLGHQSIAAAMGGRVVRAERIMHGKCDQIDHDQSDLFEGVPTPYQAVRYHSLVAEPQSLPDCLRVNAWSCSDRQIMAFSHRFHPTFGVQFHPESILTQYGKTLLFNFMNRAQKFWLS